MLIFVVFALWAVAKTFDAPKMGLAALFGLAFGLLIERAQICFTSAFRDLWITGRTQMAKAIIIGMAVSTIGVYSYVQLGVSPKILWAGPNALIGGLLFGFGIVLAGGCETGWMYRAVEGQVHFWWEHHRCHIAGGLVGRYCPGTGHQLRQSQFTGGLRSARWIDRDLSELAAAMLAVIWWEKHFFARKASITQAAVLLKEAA